MAKWNDTSVTRSTKIKVCQERQSKVSRSFYEYQPKTNDDYPIYHRVQHVPWIQMKGKWLQQAGFDIDTPVKIRVMNGCLVLTKEES